MPSRKKHALIGIVFSISLSAIFTWVIWNRSKVEGSETRHWVSAQAQLLSCEDTLRGGLRGNSYPAADVRFQWLDTTEKTQETQEVILHLSCKDLSADTPLAIRIGKDRHNSEKAISEQRWKVLQAGQ